MRKSTLTMVCLAALALLASCKKDVQPTINIATGGNYAGPNTEVFSNDPVTVGFSATGENLTRIEMSASQNGTILFTDGQNIDNLDTYLYVHNFELEAVGTVTFTGTVTDAKGHTATTSFDIIYYEKPNAKFVGNYTGDALVTGTYDINITNYDPIHENLEDEPFPIILDIVAGEDINKVKATITINDQTDTVEGTVNGNSVTFEAVNDSYTMTYEAQGFSIPITLDMTYNFVGTLNEGKLDLSGSCKGNGEFNMFIISGTIELEGTVGGSLTKSE